MPVTRIRDEFHDYEIDAEVVAGPVSTEYDSRGRRRVRWMEATLYRKADGTYVLHQVNKSLVWHLDSGTGHVRKPEERDAARLSPGAVYCGDLPERAAKSAHRGSQCRSLPARRIPDRVIVELPQHKVITSLPDEAAVIREVSSARRPDGSVSVAMSEPMRELLAEAAEKIPAFDTARPVVAM